MADDHSVDSFNYLFKKYGNQTGMMLQETAKTKSKDELNWYQEPKYFIMEINRDGSWINDIQIMT